MCGLISLVNNNYVTTTQGNFGVCILWLDFKQSTQRYSTMAQDKRGYHRPCRGTSNEFPHNTFLWRNKKNMNTLELKKKHLIKSYGVLSKYNSYFPIKTYVLGIHQKHLASLMSTRVSMEIRKI